ncbi:RNA polymerase factor sigma-54 [Aureimonas psammosilenae]|uniref:RNA polymerase factor sigma-54 n=1 Tax=Aureimonas psammosilenae TaxID=2495496 RepID=UPI001260F364|nr:RNA polymerase factor sigma-54 [Aureimonas psammosilenae]
MLSARLQLRQSQSLALTPQLLQSIRLLQYSHMELDAFVQEEIERNPMLERGEAAEEPGEAFAPESTEAPAETVPEPFGDAGGSVATTGVLPSERGSAQASYTEFLSDERPSLGAHVLGEITEIFSDPTEQAIAGILAGHLDEAGYYRGDTAALALSLGLGLATVQDILDRARAAIEPAGLFAEDLGQCLSLQLARRDRLDPVMRTVLAHLELLARRDFATLRRLTGEDEAGLLDVLAEIRRLDPKPGHGFETGDAGAIVPDVVVGAAADGSWRIELNPAALPRVIVNGQYALGVSAAGLDEAGRNFLSECQTSANWLARSLDQRARTILKVAAEIVRRQDEFLVKGITGLKPMTLMAVAESIGMHESTVSRVTANKYIATPRGTFEMKFFFTVAIAATGGGDAHSAESVKHRIRLLVDGESGSGVLSDDDIADRLRTDGVDLARRTVAKYREALGIPSSIQRRREMNARRMAS